MSERETKVLTGMLDMIFDTPSPGSTGTSKDMPLGVGRGHVDDLFAKLRRHSKPLRWAKDPSSSLLDQKKEAMGHCSTDQELLEWAEREVFEESRRYEEEARRAIAEASAKGGTAELPMLQSPIYAQMIAHLMRTFRVHYNDPNIALFIFHHAQKLSIVSYVFGCSTEAYNELIETRWTCFRDLQEVHQAVEEMVVNGVPVDSRTRKIIESMRRDLGSLELRDGATEDRQQEVLKALTNVEWLVASTAEDTSRRAGHSWDQWKNEVSKDTSLEDWSFDDWESLKSLPSTSTTGRYRGSGRPGRDRPRSRREASMY
ncbi:hypothetical protein NLJ89_g369 [Agrocybe chaxingu]|uniref:Mtf2-like C-terminal domain-containing protein n=1 Tax=Agrocybe chaxingu TaxID=84603 RepID=A0A9W8TF62_9AGAR|nr:hypothetical protein NLJ89_g369 [Agrocybe chaxingu]